MAASPCARVHAHAAQARPCLPGAAIGPAINQRPQRSAALRGPQAIVTRASARTRRYECGRVLMDAAIRPTMSQRLEQSAALRGPGAIVAGASARTRRYDCGRVLTVVDRRTAYLLARVARSCGLVAAGAP